MKRNKPKVNTRRNIELPFRIKIESEKGDKNTSKFWLKFRTALVNKLK